MVARGAHTRHDAHSCSLAYGGTRGTGLAAKQMASYMCIVHHHSKPHDEAPGWLRESSYDTRGLPQKHGTYLPEAAGWLRHRGGMIHTH